MEEVVRLQHKDSLLILHKENPDVCFENKKETIQ
jgi:hypothetical protein